MKRFFLIILALGFALVATGCSIVRKPSLDELRSLDHPPADVVAKIDKLFPSTLVWYEKVESELLAQGRPLTDSESERAVQLDVLKPGRVRIVVLETFPLPEEPELRKVAQEYGFGSVFEGGRTIGYAIMLKPRFRNNSTIIGHELVHVAQHERMGRRKFIRRYLTEVEMLGSFRSPLEIEAYEKQ